jgi:ABC-2 type transport system permease protein
VLVATWASPVLYQVSMVEQVVPDWLLFLYRINPLTAGVELMHAGFWYSTTEQSAPMSPGLWTTSLIALAISMTVLVIGQVVFRKLEGRFAQDL